MNISSLGKPACILIASCFSFSATAATLDVVGGQLMGAFGVEVEGNFYDVRFLDGTCIDLYDGCDELTDFTFQTASSALAATQALMDTVFLDGGGGSFDSEPDLTSGIDDPFNAYIFSPYNISELYVLGESYVDSAFFYNGGSQTFDSAEDCGFCSDPAYDTSNVGYIAWAVWSPSPVPAPAALVLFASALAGMTGVRLTRLNKST